MTYIIAVFGFVLLSVALWDSFEVIISPRRVTRSFRFTRAFYRSSWWLWSAVARSIANENRRETYLDGRGTHPERVFRVAVIKADAHLEPVGEADPI